MAMKVYITLPELQNRSLNIRSSLVLYSGHLVFAEGLFIPHTGFLKIEAAH